MTSVSIPGVHSWGNRYGLGVRGVSGLSPGHGGGRRAPVCFGPPPGPAACFQPLVSRDVLVHPQCLLKPSTPDVLFGPPAQETSLRMTRPMASGATHGSSRIAQPYANLRNGFEREKP